MLLEKWRTRMFAQRIPDLPLANRVGTGLADLISLFFWVAIYGGDTSIAFPTMSPTSW